ncbi:MAG: hypothetical protein HKL89_00840 [Candidatus Dormibacteraeota bacterium]|nr:hypothetical protein [Candidatus Dormibacteraeota bacterium]
MGPIASLDLFGGKLHAFHSWRSLRGAPDVWAQGKILEQEIADRGPLLFARDQGMLGMDGRLPGSEPVRAAPLSQLSGGPRVLLDDATLRGFLLGEVESVARRIATASLSWLANPPSDGPESGAPAPR